MLNLTAFVKFPVKFMNLLLVQATRFFYDPTHSPQCSRAAEIACVTVPLGLFTLLYGDQGDEVIVRSHTRYA